MPTHTNFTVTWDIVNSYLQSIGKDSTLVAATVRDDAGNEDCFATLIGKEVGVPNLSFLEFLKSNAIDRRIIGSDGRNLKNIFYGHAYFTQPDYNFAGFGENYYDIFKEISATGDYAAVAAKYNISPEEVDGIAGLFFNVSDIVSDWIKKPSSITITKPTQSGIDKLSVEDSVYRAYTQSPYNIPVISLTDVLNNGKDIVIHSCLTPIFKTP